MSKIMRALKEPRLLVVLLMGFYSGLPFLLIGNTLKTWLRQDGVDLSTIGFFAAVGLPYSFKFLWAPVVDRFSFFQLGRRRTWLIVTQIGLTLSILFMSTIEPSKQMTLVITAAVLISFWSATQDIVVDAYRREILPDIELGLGASLSNLGYRLGMLLSNAGVFVLADHVAGHWHTAYQVVAIVMATGLVVTIFAREPAIEGPLPRNFKESVLDPLKDFFSRAGAWVVLAFVLFYKIGESMASDMYGPFYLDMKFSLTEIAGVAKVFGIWSAIVGGLVGGILILRLKLYRSLWVFGIMQSAGLLLFSVLSMLGHNIWVLAIAIVIENFTSGMASSAYGAFMASQTNRKFTGTQYALLTSMMSVPARFFGMTTGVMAQHLGWFWYFIACTVITVPGLLLIFAIRGKIQEQGL